MSRFILFLIGCSLTLSLSAQRTGYFRLFKIDSVVQKGDRTFVIIPFGTRDGVNPEATPMIYTTYSESMPGRDGMYSLGMITKSQDQQTWIEPLLVLHDEITLQKGDLVGIQTWMKTAAWNENPLFKLALRNIGLMDVYDSLYHDDKHYFEQTDEKTYQADLMGMIEDIQFTGSAMREQMNDVPVDSGRYEGKMLLDIMENITRNDLELFFEYMIARPDKYQGFDWKLSEIFATWVVSGAPEVIRKKEEASE